MTKICNDKTGNDKKLHVFCEFVIAVFVGVFVSFIHFSSSWIVAAISFVVAISVGIWREVKNSRQKGNHFCIWDLLWDIPGCLGGSVVAFFTNSYTWHDIARNLLQ